MACDPFCLRSDGLSGADPGGTWTNTDGNYNGGALVGDDPCVNWSDLSPGDNEFEYEITGCDGNPATATVTLYQMILGSIGPSLTINLCEDDSAVNLETQLSVVVGVDGTGSWSGDTANPGWSEPNFDPSLSGVGTFVFTYTIVPDPPGGYVDLMCCDPISGTVTVNVTAGSNPGSGGSFSGC